MILNQVFALGLQNWHAFWGPVKAWADYHQGHNGDALQFFASIATVAGLPLLTILIIATLGFHIGDRIQARRHHALQRRVILLGLKTELRGTRDTAIKDLDLVCAPEGTTAWTFLPHTSVEQALIEAGLLDLTSEQIVELHELRLRILRANSLLSATLSAPQVVSRDQAEPRSWRDRCGREIREQFEAITGLCDNLLDRLHAA